MERREAAWGVSGVYCRECRPVILGNSPLIIIISISGLVETSGTHKVAHFVCKIPVFGLMVGKFRAIQQNGVESLLELNFNTL